MLCMFLFVAILCLKLENPHCHCYWGNIPTCTNTCGKMSTLPRNGRARLPPHSSLSVSICAGGACASFLGLKFTARPVHQVNSKSYTSCQVLAALSLTTSHPKVERVPLSTFNWNRLLHPMGSPQQISKNITNDTDTQNPVPSCTRDGWSLVKFCKQRGLHHVTRLNLCNFVTPQWYHQKTNDTAEAL